MFYVHGACMCVCVFLASRRRTVRRNVCSYSFFSSIFGPNLPNLTGQPVEHEFADTVMHKRSNIHVERDFEYILGKLEDVMRNQGSDYYKVLGVKPSAGIEEIKQAYRKEVRASKTQNSQGSLLQAVMFCVLILFGFSVSA